MTAKNKSSAARPAASSSPNAVRISPSAAIAAGSSTSANGPVAAIASHRPYSIPKSSRASATCPSRMESMTRKTELPPPGVRVHQTGIDPASVYSQRPAPLPPARTPWAWRTATFFSIGRLKPGPGTWASLAITVLWYLALSPAEPTPWQSESSLWPPRSPLRSSAFPPAPSSSAKAASPIQDLWLSTKSPASSSPGRYARRSRPCSCRFPAVPVLRYREAVADSPS